MKSQDNREIREQDQDRPILKTKAIGDGDINESTGDVENHYMTPILIKLSKKSARYAINCSNQRIGIIRPGIDCWIASASMQFGAFECKLPTKREAIAWLVENFQTIDSAGILLSVDRKFFHYTVESDFWLIKIDVFDDFCRSAVVEGGKWVEYYYFPDLNSAIACSFTLILNPGCTIGTPSGLEF